MSARRFHLCVVVASVLLAACAPRLYQRQTIELDHRELDQFEIRYAEFEGCLLQRQVPVSYRLRRPQYTLDLAVHFGSRTEPASLDLALSGGQDLTARFPGLKEAPAAVETEQGAVRYRFQAERARTDLSLVVLRGETRLGEEYLRIEHSTCRALSLGE